MNLGYNNCNKDIRIMCGIFAVLNNNDLIITKDIMKDAFKKGEHRGPEYSTLNSISIKTIMGFHRLAINGLDEVSHQPINIGNITLICNGEIYNYKQLYTLLPEYVSPTTNSDCEVIIHLYKAFGMDTTLQLLDGVFSFVLIDQLLGKNATKLYVARDPYGIRPLFIMNNTNSSDSDSVIAFASEMKSLKPIQDELNEYYTNKRDEILMDNPRANLKNKYKQYQIQPFKPGSYQVYKLPFHVSPHWKLEKQVKYNTFAFNTNVFTKKYDFDHIMVNIQTYFKEAVFKRCIAADRPIACLLSGGLDSSLVTALVNEYHKMNNLPQLETYSIGMEGSEDLKYAQQVADYLGTKHTQVTVSEEEFVDAIPKVIYDIESYDTTTVRASVGNWLIAKYISEHSEAKVIFNGDGADELMGGYLYMKHAGNCVEFDKECKRLLTNIHQFDVLRSDRCISSHGLEPRTPFLDRTWVNYYLSLPFTLRYSKDDQEKYLIRKAFSEEYFNNREGISLLPPSILWRRKEAFSDGVANEKTTTREIIYKHIHSLDSHAQFVSLFNDPNIDNKENILKLVKAVPETKHLTHLLPETLEQFYYRYIFEIHYKGCGKAIPYFWMPNYVKAQDSSARSLDIYKEDVETDYAVLPNAPDDFA